MSLKQLLTITCVMLFAVSINSQVPNTMNYQGRLTDGSNLAVTDGNYLVKFIIYDASVGGTNLWNSGAQPVSTVDGLFSYELGSMISLPLDIFDDSTRYLGITVGADAELTPRTKMNTVPYARTIDGSDYVKRSGDTMTGLLHIENGSGTVTAELSGSSGGFRSFGLDGNLRTTLTSFSYGVLGLYDGAYSQTVQLNANPSSGGSLLLNDPNGDEDIYLHAGLSGNYTFNIPVNAIDNIEILDEPGLTSSNGSSTLIPNGNSTMSDIVTTTITTPSAGYIFLVSKCYVLHDGTVSLNTITIQIDETSGGGTVSSRYLTVGHSSYHSTSAHRFPTTLTSVFYKSSAGTYTFRLEASKNGTNGTSTVYQPTLTAIYIPTSYGSVATVADNPMGDDDAKLVSITDEEGNTHTGYEIDLRNLELKAKEAALKLKQAELELLKAQQQQNNSNK